MRFSLPIALAFTAASATALAGLASPTSVSAAATPAAASAPTSFTGCFAHRPTYSLGSAVYTAGCSGHDEPELDPVSATAGSARDITWHVTLPKDGTTTVDSVGPTFWFGGTVHDPKGYGKQAFLELQFYPDSRVQRCGANGGYRVSYVKDAFTACSPVWKLEKSGSRITEPAAFNTMLRDGNSARPLVMRALDELRIHIFATSMSKPYRVEVADLTTGHSGGYWLISPTDGPLTPQFDRQVTGNSLDWGIVHDTPMSFVWEIGHHGNYVDHPGKFCLPGQSQCASYDAAHWAGFTPLKISSVVFGNGTHPRSWSVVSDYGGANEVSAPANCPVYGGKWCIYPWFADNGPAFTYGVDYPGTRHDYGQAAQFEQLPQCAPNMFGDRTYCSVQVKPYDDGS